MTDVVLPCRNEAPALPGLLARMPAGYRAIVVDNGSTDGSAAVARAHGAEVISVAEPGYGAAVHAGVLAADPADGVVCVMDADGSFDPAQLPRLAGPVRSGEAQLGTGRRRPAARGVWPLHARVANAVLARRLRRTTGLPVHDLGPIRVGMDTPQVSAGHLDAVLSLLGAAGGPDAVLGPAADGGWWALGLRDPGHASVLRTIPTSTATTGEQTLAALRGSGLRVRLLPRLRDVDTAADARAVAALCPPGSRFARAVAAEVPSPVAAR